MAWGTFSAAGVGPFVRLNCKVNANVYQNPLQRHAVLPLRASLNQPANFMIDNASCHTATLPKVSRNFSTMKELRF